MPAAESQKRRRTEDVGAVEAGADLAEELHRVTGLTAVRHDPDEVAKGGQPSSRRRSSSSARNRVTSPRRRSRSAVNRPERLDDHAAGRIPPGPGRPAG